MSGTFQPPILIGFEDPDDDEPEVLIDVTPISSEIVREGDFASAPPAPTNYVQPGVRTPDPVTGRFLLGVVAITGLCLLVALYYIAQSVQP